MVCLGCSLGGYGACALVVGVSIPWLAMPGLGAGFSVYLLFGALSMVVCGFDWFVGWCLLACKVLYLYRADAPILVV